MSATDATFSPVDQDRFHYPERREYGNCWSACIASITGLSLDALREFHRLYSAFHEKCQAGDRVSWETHAAYSRELRLLGWHVQPVVFGSDLIVPKGYSIAGGPGPRGCEHSCVALDGRIIHDPHPSRDGLIEISDYEILVPVVTEGAS